MPEFRALMQKYFHHVFMFSMNDEVVHTGYTRWRITSLRSAVQNVMFKVQTGLEHKAL